MIDCPVCGVPATLRRTFLGGYSEVRCLTHGYRVVGSVPPPPPNGTIDAGMEGSASSGRKWTMVEQLEVDRAIERVASRMAEFTADDVWRELGPDFYVTKGLAGRLMAARGQGLIRSTDRVTFSQRVGEHGHGQRLAVWLGMGPG
jgi:hypothetical protein